MFVFVFVFVDNMTTYFHNSNLQVFSITFPSHFHHIADLTSMKVISFCTVSRVCVDKRYTWMTGVPYKRTYDNDNDNDSDNDNDNEFILLT